VYSSSRRLPKSMEPSGRALHTSAGILSITKSAMTLMPCSDASTDNAYHQAYTRYKDSHGQPGRIDLNTGKRKSLR
jgi:hypothetical protein